ncbi:LacI family DNA-binding transcriptional regulator [Janibacter anophelis]|uniref:LacI family DNA-binding transcriptional regulator n=1 Tax=Janibacter anophelis TaxID=319054 RepID=UPI00082F9AFB|nr:LacI family DNA-binding transcriptional regulator [Janibacter anophelis]
MRGHRIADVAEQSGLSSATVDRVLHGRPGASPRAVRAVEQAVAELDRQATALRLGARAFVLDVVMQAPDRFSGAVREAVESQLTVLRPAAVRARFHLRESGTVDDVAATLEGIGRRGRTSHGVLLKAPDDPRVAAAIDDLAGRGIPTVTLMTDVHRSRRVAYAGPDHDSAGRTAAHVVHRWGATEHGTMLVTMSRSSFVGERTRVEAFVEQLAADAPGLVVRRVTDADGLDASTRAVVAAELEQVTGPVGVYSVGGANRAIIAALRAKGVTPFAHVGHDLDADNLALLRAGEIDLVLHHDLREDARSAIRAVLQHHGLAPGAPLSMASGVQVVTRHNIPARLAPR